jgi:hypothetical protein
MQTIDKFNFAGKKAFVRVDFNVPLDENFNITDDTRMRAALPTLKKILADGGSIIIGSHLGRPKGVADKFSLKHIIKHLSELLGVEVQFANDCMGEEAAVKAAALQPGEVLLLENLRFYAEEEGKPRGLAEDATDEEKAAMAVDTHVFRVSHRIGLVPDSCTTPFSVEKELVKNIPEKLIPIAHHWLILHGRYVCQARTPKCDTCGLQMMCKYFCNTYKVTKEEPKAKNK